MTSHGSVNRRADFVSSHDLTSSPENVNKEARSKSKLVRRAEAVASGQVPFPADLPESEAERLRLEVVCRRRQLFVTFIARTINRDIQDGTKKLQGGKTR